MIGYAPKDEIAKGPLFFVIGVMQVAIGIQAFRSKNWALFGIATAASLVILRSIIMLKRAKVRSL